MSLFGLTSFLVLLLVISLPNELNCRSLRFERNEELVKQPAILKIIDSKNEDSIFSSSDEDSFIILESPEMKTLEESIIKESSPEEEKEMKHVIVIDKTKFNDSKEKRDIIRMKKTTSTPVVYLPVESDKMNSTSRPLMNAAAGPGELQSTTRSLTNTAVEAHSTVRPVIHPIVEVTAIPPVNAATGPGEFQSSTRPLMHSTSGSLVKEATAIPI